VVNKGKLPHIAIHRRLRGIFIDVTRNSINFCRQEWAPTVLERRQSLIFAVSFVQGFGTALLFVLVFVLEGFVFVLEVSL